jgi:hypothetical protein
MYLELAIDPTDNIYDVAGKAKQMAMILNIAVCFTYNSVSLRVTGRTNIVELMDNYRKELDDKLNQKEG